MPRLTQYEAYGRTRQYQKLQQLRDFLRDVFGAQQTAAEVTPTHIRVHVRLPHGEEFQLESTQDPQASEVTWTQKAANNESGIFGISSSRGFKKVIIYHMYGEKN